MNGGQSDEEHGHPTSGIGSWISQVLAFAIFGPWENGMEMY